MPVVLLYRPTGTAQQHRAMGWKMEFHGSNAALGYEQVELSERRFARPIVAVSDETPLFPLGIGGLVPVLTTKASGVETATYAFAFDEGEVELPANDAQPDGGAVDAEAVGTADGEERSAGEDEADVTDVTDKEDEDASLPAVAVSPEQEPVLKALVDAVVLVNGMLLQAAELSGYPFGQVGAIQLGVGPRGVGFTRVDPTSETSEQRASGVALTLHIETTDENPGAPESFSAIIDYNESGEPIRIAMLEYTEDDYAFRAAANIDDETGELSIHKVERIDRRIHSERLMYKRGRDAAQVDPECWENRERKDANVRRSWSGKPYANDGYRSGGRRGGYRGDDRDDRRGGYRDDRRYDDRRYDRRGGYDDRYDGRRSDRGGYRDRDDRGDYRDRGGRDRYRTDRDDRRYDDRRGGYDDRRRADYGYRDDRSGRDDRGYRGDDRRGGYRADRGGYRGDRGPTMQ